MSIIIRSYRDGDRDDVVALWDGCGLLRPWNDPNKDIRRKQGHEPTPPTREDSKN